MTLVEELQYIVSTWGRTPEGTQVMVLYKDEALPVLHSLMDKMGCFGDGPHGREWQLVNKENDFEKYFSDITQGWTSDYAFILRYEGDLLPTVVALIERAYPHVAVWRYMTGGLSLKREPMCAGEVLQAKGRKLGLIRELLYEVGIREIRMSVTPDTAMHRGAIVAGYTFEPHPTDPARLKGTRKLTREEYGRERRQISVEPTRSEDAGSDH